MGISERRILCVAVMVCLLRLEHTDPVTCRFSGLDVAQAEPTTADRQNAAEPDRSMPERFMVMDRGCALLGPDGEEKERLEPSTNEEGAISPDGRWATFLNSEPDPPPPDK